MIGLDDVRAAALRIAGHVRRTPLLAAAPVREPSCPDAEVALKLECLQITGSFKARGAMNRLLAIPAGEVARGIVTASGGNHGLGVAYAGWKAGVPAIVYLPANTPPEKAEKIAAWGARVVGEGDVWDDAHRAASALAERDGLPYFHPFADPDVIAGQGTAAMEILEDAPDTDILLVPIGGGGLIAGVSLAAKAIKPDIRVIGVEPEGAPTLKRSLEAGRVVTLDGIATAANTLAPRRTAEITFEIIRANVDEVVLVSDDEMAQAARWLWREMGVGAELAGAATSAALRSAKVRPVAGETVCAIVSGAGTAGVRD